MGTRALVLGGAALTVGLGVVSVLVLDRGETPIPSSSSELAIANGPILSGPSQAQLDFLTMAVEYEQPDCRPPRPPKELAQLTLTRNGYAAILEILAMRLWKKTGSCECFYEKITWDGVLAAAPEFERTDGVNLRFDVPKLRVEADLLAAQRSQVCPE